MIRKFWPLVPLRKIIGMNRAPPLMLYPDFFFKKKISSIVKQYISQCYHDDLFVGLQL